MKLFSGRVNYDFAKKIALHLNTQLSDLKISTFADGEIKVLIKESIRQQDCFIIQPTCNNYDQNINVNDGLIELFILIDALKLEVLKV